MSREPQWQIRLLLDGACPLCRREGAFLRRLDRGRGRLVVEDISAPGCDPGRYGLTRADALARIHGVLPDGTVLSGMEVFRRAYAAVGLGWLLAPTGWPLLRPVFDQLYAWFARNRPRLAPRGRRTCAPARIEDGGLRAED